jgi:hypothetical protein
MNSNKEDIEYSIEEIDSIPSYAINCVLYIKVIRDIGGFWKKPRNC